MPRRKPYDPSCQGPQVHDRRAGEISRGYRGHIVEAEVEDPYERGARIGVLRSVRDDPLADHHARGHIDQAQYLAGREFQKYFRIAERGPRAVRWEDAVDGNPPIETLTDAQLGAAKWLSRCYIRLGADGSAIVHAALIEAMSARQIAAARGLAGQDWQRYISRRLGEALNCLAVVFGLSSRG